MSSGAGFSLSSPLRLRTPKGSNNKNKPGTNWWAWGKPGRKTTDEQAPKAEELKAENGSLEEKVCSGQPCSSGILTAYVPPVGSMLGPYELKAVMGTGTFSTVYAATRPADCDGENAGEVTPTHTAVALKVLTRAGDRAAEYDAEMWRLRRVSKVPTAALVVRLVEGFVYGEAPLEDDEDVCDQKEETGRGPVWYCMCIKPLCEGGTLQEAIERKVRPNFYTLMAVVRWAGQVARTLHLLHEHQIYHGDITPSNIMLKAVATPHPPTPDTLPCTPTTTASRPDAGQATYDAYLIDMGIPAHDHPRVSLGPRTHGAFIAPEKVTAVALAMGGCGGMMTVDDAKAEVWSWGVMLHALLTRSVERLGNRDAQGKRAWFIGMSEDGAVDNGAWQCAQRVGWRGDVQRTWRQIIMEGCEAEEKHGHAVHQQQHVQRHSWPISSQRHRAKHPCTSPTSPTSSSTTLPDVVPSGLLDLLSECVRGRASDRPTMSAVADRMEALLASIINPTTTTSTTTTATTTIRVRPPITPIITSNEKAQLPLMSPSPSSTPSTITMHSAFPLTPRLQSPPPLQPPPPSADQCARPASAEHAVGNAPTLTSVHCPSVPAADTDHTNVTPAPTPLDLLRRAEVLRFAGRVDDANRCMEQLVRMVGVGDGGCMEGELASVYMAWGQELVDSGRVKEGIKAFAKGLESAATVPPFPFTTRGRTPTPPNVGQTSSFRATATSPPPPPSFHPHHTNRSLSRPNSRLSVRPCSPSTFTDRDHLMGSLNLLSGVAYQKVNGLVDARTHLEAALSHFQRSMERQASARHRVCQTLAVLTSVCHRMGRLKEAVAHADARLRLMKKGEAENRTPRGGDAVRVVCALEQLGGLKVEMGDDDGALHDLKEAVRKLSTLPGKVQVAQRGQLAEILEYLACIYDRKPDRMRALKARVEAHALQRAIEMQPGDDSDGRVKLVKATLSDTLSRLPEETPEVARCQLSVASVYREKCLWQDALSHARRAADALLRVDVGLMSSDHAVIAIKACVMVGDLFRSQDTVDLTEAKLAYDQALRLTKRTLNVCQPAHAHAVACVARAYDYMGMMEEAHKLCKAYLHQVETCATAAHHQHRHHSTSHESLTGGCISSGNSSTTTTSLPTTPTFNTHSTAVLRAMSLLAEQDFIRGRVTSSIAILTKALSTAQRSSPPVDIYTVAHASVQLGLYLCEAGRYAEAESVAVEAMTMTKEWAALARRPRDSGCEKVDVRGAHARALRGVALAKLGRGKLGDAKRYLVEGYEVLRGESAACVDGGEDDEDALEGRRIDHMAMAEYLLTMCRHGSELLGCDAALRYGREGLSHARRVRPMDLGVYAGLLMSIAELYMHNGTPERGIAYAEEATEVLASAHAHAHTSSSTCLNPANPSYKRTVPTMALTHAQPPPLVRAIVLCADLHRVTGDRKRALTLYQSVHGKPGVDGRATCDAMRELMEHGGGDDQGEMSS